MVPGRRAQRAVEIARPRRPPGGGDDTGDRRRAAAGAEAALRQQPQGGGGQARGQAGEIDLERGGDIERLARLGGAEAAVEKGIGHRVDGRGVAAPEAGDDGGRLRRHRSAVESAEDRRKPVLPGGIAAVAIGRDGRHARFNRLLQQGRLDPARRRQGRGGGMLGLGEPRHEAQPFRHRVPGGQELEPPRGGGKSRRGIGQDQRLRRGDAAGGRAGPFAVRRDLALSHRRYPAEGP